MPTEPHNQGRRQFITGLLATGGLLATLGAGWIFRDSLRKNNSIAVDGLSLGADHQRGHRLRNPSFPEARQIKECQVLIAGAGIAGLSAARHLVQSGISDFILCELENETGGNSRGGLSGQQAFPWGAHYLPLPDPADEALMTFLRECSVVTTQNEAGLPVYNPLFICHDPEERLFIHGQWQEGLLPQLGVSADEKARMAAFLSAMDVYRSAIGSDGRRAFALPVDDSSADEEWRRLDRISFSLWLKKNDFDLPHLRWYAEYACRDDYGSRLADTSAWAGIHYFASRRGLAANAKAGEVLTWPEGNAFLARQLAAASQPQLRKNAMVWRVNETAQGCETDVFDFTTGETVRFRSRAVIVSAPQFVAQRLVPARQFSTAFQYSPWVVAAVTLQDLPQGPGAALSWDNVSYHSPSLGYIASDHNELRSVRKGPIVISWYQPLDHLPPSAARQEAMNRKWTEWKDLIVADLESMHPGITASISRVDVWLWGHGMVRPVPGFLWGGEREAAQKPVGNIHFAHSDVAGLSLFEEAFHRGRRVAQQVIESLAHT